jgi:hypothetical protein
MKNVLVILDGPIGKHLIKRMIDLNNNLNQYDIIYMDDKLVPESKPSNFIFYKFDPTSYSKLSFLLKKVLYQDALIVLDSKEDTLSVIKNIRKVLPLLNFAVYDEWNLDVDENIKYYRGFDILSNGLVEQLPNIPVFAQNIGLRQGEIMEIKIPFGSNYAYRYIGSIGQKDWKIAALYRADTLVSIKPTLVLKPNDVIIVVGKPEVLTQVYSAISKSSSQFPMPFGANLYLYIDLFIQAEDEVFSAIEDAKILHKRFNNNNDLIIKITRPTTVDMIERITKEFEGIEKIIIEVDYHNLGIHKILKKDKLEYDIGMLILTKSLLKHKEAIKDIVSLKLPIFKVGSEHISTLKSSLILLNDNKLYEQISPLLFDISSQLKIKPKVFNIDPIGDTQRDELVSHLINLSKIFGQNLAMIKEKANPIKRLQKESNVLQILPLKPEMFEKRRIKFLNTDSDLLSYDLSNFNQILVPVIDEIS